MNWWQRLKKNPLARFGAILLLVFYVAVIAADFIAPYDPYVTQANGSLLPPTQVYWFSKSGQFIGPHVYPTTQGDTNLETGKRELIVDHSKPSPLRLFVQGSEYHLFQLSFPVPPKWDEVTIIPGIPLNWHLFGTTDNVKFNFWVLMTKVATNSPACCMVVALVYLLELSGYLLLFPLVCSLGEFLAILAVGLIA